MKTKAMLLIQIGMLEIGARKQTGLCFFVQCDWRICTWVRNEGQFCHYTKINFLSFYFSIQPNKRRKNSTFLSFILLS